jgi:hypothetical protein
MNVELTGILLHWTCRQEACTYIMRLVFCFRVMKPYCDGLFCQHFRDAGDLSFKSKVTNSIPGLHIYSNGPLVYGSPLVLIDGSENMCWPLGTNSLKKVVCVVNFMCTDYIL